MKLRSESTNSTTVTEKKVISEERVAARSILTKLLCRVLKVNVLWERGGWTEEEGDEINTWAGHRLNKVLQSLHFRLLAP